MALGYSLLCVLLLCSVGFLPVASAESSTFEELVVRLADDDYSVRREAVRKLGERAEEFWEPMEQACKDSRDAEVRANLREAMLAPTLKSLAQLVEKTKQTLALESKNFTALEEAADVSMNDCSLSEAEHTRVAAVLEANLGRAGVFAANLLEANIAAIRVAAEEQAGQMYKLKAERHLRQAAFRMRSNFLLSQRDQIEQAIRRRRALGRKPLTQWDPKLLSFGERLKLKVTFEFSDTPSEEVAPYITALTGIPIEYANPVELSLTLRVRKMKAPLALDWIARLQGLKARIDQKAEKIIIEKERPNEETTAPEADQEEPAEEEED